MHWKWKEFNRKWKEIYWKCKKKIENEKKLTTNMTATWGRTDDDDGDDNEYETTKRSRYNKIKYKMKKQNKE